MSDRASSLPEPAVDADAVLCALILAPLTYSRNRHFQLFEQGAMRRARRRAKRVRGILRHLLGHGRNKAEIVGEQVLEDGSVLLRYRVENLAYERTTALTDLEAAALYYALDRAGVGTVPQSARRKVERALGRLCDELGLGPGSSGV